MTEPAPLAVTNALLYLDASALVKLVRAEPETGPLRAYLEGADLVSSDVVRERAGAISEAAAPP